MNNRYFISDISQHIWETKYRWCDRDIVHDKTISHTWHRIANALASVEPKDQTRWAENFYSIMEGFRFLPAGRIQAGAGTGHRVTLFNCFVMGMVGDSMEEIFDNLKEGALTMQQGGGVGYDFSALRPRGSPAHATGSIASGPVSFMGIWDSMCATLLSTGARRGAMMGTLLCDHPDIEEFIAAKEVSHALRHFNLSIQITDDFMKAVRHGDDWPLIFPAAKLSDTDTQGEIIMRRWAGTREPVPCRVLRRVKARALWDKIMRATYEHAEPGVLFIDRINQQNNLWYREQISATNPCGEIPLPPYGACDLGSINLTCFVQNAFSDQARLDMEAIKETVVIATRFLDNVIDLSQYPLDKQKEQALGTRRIGLGITGLGDALIMLGLHYGEAQAREVAAEVMRIVCHTAYRTSIQLAREKGGFPFFEETKYLSGAFIQTLPEDIQEGIARYGIRNSHLTAIAPTGTISLLANNISSGLEPVFDWSYSRQVLEADGTYTQYQLTDYAYRLWQHAHGPDVELPDYFVDARQLPPFAHLEMQAGLQTYVDNAISKTVNVPEDYAFEDFRSLYDQAFDKGLKGCTTFRPNPVTGSVLASEKEGIFAPHCCSIEREAD